MLENTAKQCIPSLELGDLSERKMQAVSRIPAVFLTTKNSHKVEPGGSMAPPKCLSIGGPFRRLAVNDTYDDTYLCCSKRTLARGNHLR